MVKTEKYVAPPEEGSYCFDGIDNDGDSDIDCKDSGCSGAYDTGGGVYIFCADTYMWTETLNSSYEWGCYQTEINGADSDTYGEQNTIDILADCTSGSRAAEACDSLNYAGFTDWYLPAKETLSDFYGDFTCADCSWDTVCCSLSSNYWSSTEYSGSPAGYAWYVYFWGASMDYMGKNQSAPVRCVR